jgi:hypothetical protein
MPCLVGGVAKAWGHERSNDDQTAILPASTKTLTVIASGLHVIPTPPRYQHTTSALERAAGSVGKAIQKMWFLAAQLLSRAGLA